MKLKLFLTVVVSAFAFSLNACEKTSDIPLSQQYESGALQWKIVRKEIDPHTLIHEAILENSPEVISFLLAHGADVDYPDKNGMSPLTIAILNSSKDIVQILLDHGANTNPSVKWNNMTLLELTIFMRDFENAKKLVDHGADVNGAGDNGWSILSQVIQLGSSQPDLVETAKKMINKGAELRTEEIYSAIMLAESQGDLSILESLIQKGVDLNRNDRAPLPIVEATRRWNADVIKLLVKSGADINKIYNEDTALTVAISSGDIERVKLLVELGADVNQKVCRGNGKTISPITNALEHRCPKMVQYLLQHGARA